jgi:NADPH2:quinone reductase
MRSIVMTGPGGPDVLAVAEQDERQPSPGQVSVAVAAAGINFMDIGVRRGHISSDMAYPKALGVEGSGRVISVGDGVTGLAPGQRVAWVYHPGSYAEKIVAPAEALVPIPETIDDRTAAAVMMQGLTASHFATDFHAIQPGEIALVHAAAGGLGLLLTQIIRLRGGSVIGRVSSADKVAVAKAAGADHVIVDAEGRFADEVAQLTDGSGVHVVYDGSGPTTFRDSLASLRRSGTFCWYGPVLGSPGPIDIMSLPKSVKLGYATFLDHIHTSELYHARSGRLFEWIASGVLKVTIGATYPLTAAARAHADMESRTTTGKLLLLP